MRYAHFIFLFILVSTSSRAYGQYCHSQNNYSFFNAPQYSGGHFQGQALLAPAQAFQPQQYYFPQGNVQLSQPPMMGQNNNCYPPMMPQQFQTSFGQMQQPQMSPFMQALPALSDGLTGLVDYMGNRPAGRGQSYDDYVSQRDSRRSSSRGQGRSNNADFYSPDDLDLPREIPDSNSAGASGTRSVSSPTSADTNSNNDDSTSNEGPPSERTDQDVVADGRAQNTPDDNRGASDSDTVIDFTPTDGTPFHEEFDVPLVPTPLDDQLVDIVDQTQSLPHNLNNGPLSKEECRDLIRDLSNNHDPLQGAFRVMATFYQDCDSLLNILDEDTPLPQLNVSIEEDMNKIKTRSLAFENKQHYLNVHPYLKGRDFSNSGEACRDLSVSPPVFSYGAKPRYRNGHQDIDLFRNQASSGICQYSNVACESEPVTALDCSGFIHAALKASGLKLEKGPEHPHYSTAAFNDLATDENSCLEELAFSAEETLAPGDMISQSQHHIFMISSVGEDPLGVKKAVSSGDCSSISRSDFDFTFIQSGASRSIGVAHLSSDYPEVSSTMFNNLLSMAYQTCENHLEGKSRLRARAQNGRSSMMVMRHVGSDVEGCTHEQPARLEGEECVEDCFD